MGSAEIKWDEVGTGTTDGCSMKVIFTNPVGPPSKKQKKKQQLGEQSEKGEGKQYENLFDTTKLLHRMRRKGGLKPAQERKRDSPYIFKGKQK